MGEVPVQILLVEDDATHSELIFRAFEPVGEWAEITLARTVREARRHLSRFTPDVAVVDVGLPDGQGIALLPEEESVGSRPDFPLVIMTSQGDQKTAVEAMRRGALDYVVKSDVTFADMPHIVQRALREWTGLRERIMAEEARAVSEARLAGILELAPEAIISISEDQRIRLFNQGARRIFGYAADEVLGRPIDLLIPEDARSGHRKLVTQFRQSDGMSRRMAPDRAVRARRKDGSEFPAEVAISKLVQHGEATYTVMLQDVTDRIRHERELEKHRNYLEELVQQRTAELAEKVAELRRSNEELEQFAYVVSHDLQEPLRMVSSYTQLLARRYQGKLDADADDFIRFAVDGATRMQKLIKALLRYSRVGSGKTEFGEVDMAAVVDRVFRDLQVAAGDAGAVLEAGDLPVVWADSSQMGQLMLNLVSNSIRYRGDAPPLVKVSAERADEYWQFSVSDNGCGIDENFQDRAFVIYERLHPIPDRRGVGLGLAIAKKIVERHGGRIWFESRVGRGTTFHFTISTRAHGHRPDSAGVPAGER